MTSGKNPQAPWLEAAQEFQQNLIAQWTQAAQAFPGAAATGPSASDDPFAAFKAFMPQGTVAQPFGVPGGAAGFPGFTDLFEKAAGQKVHVEPAQMLAIQTTYLQEMAALWSQGAHIAPVRLALGNAVPKRMGVDFVLTNDRRNNVTPEVVLGGFAISVIF